MYTEILDILFCDFSGKALDKNAKSGIIYSSIEYPYNKGCDEDGQRKSCRESVVGANRKKNAGTHPFGAGVPNPWAVGSPVRAA